MGAPKSEKRALLLARMRRLGHSTRVPAIRYEVHRRVDHPSIWVAHDNQGTCEKRGDDYCQGVHGFHSTGGANAQAYLIDEATKDARRRWATFVTEMQARGKVFG